MPLIIDVGPVVCEPGLAALPLQPEGRSEFRPSEALGPLVKILGNPTFNNVLTS